jgi:hypothetical protein
MVCANELVALKRSSDWGTEWKDYEDLFSTGDLGPFLLTINPLGDKSYFSEVRIPIHAAKG